MQTKVFYEKLEVSKLYIFTSPEINSNKFLLLTKERPDEIKNLAEKSYVPSHTPFMILDKLSFGDTCGDNSGYENTDGRSYRIIWTNNDNEAVIGWIDSVWVLSEDLSFYEASIENTKDFNQLEIQKEFNKFQASFI